MGAGVIFFLFLPAPVRIVALVVIPRSPRGVKVCCSDDGRGVKLFARGGEVNVASVKAWELMPSNPS